LKVIAWLSGLDKFLVQVPSDKGRPSRILLASTEEALVGAVWIDSGKDFKAVRSVIEILGIVGPGTEKGVLG